MVLGLTLYININLIMKFIYTPCKCLICRTMKHLNISVKSYKFILNCVIQCKCKNQYIYIDLHGYVKQFKCKTIVFFRGKSTS